MTQEHRQQIRSVLEKALELAGIPPTWIRLVSLPRRTPRFWR